MTTTELEKEKENQGPNAKQQECIDNINGKYLVLAGPGTGKTYTVIQRIKAMLDQKIDPQKILCLSFSTTAANEMQNKMSKIFDKADTGVDVYTFHAFCNEIIENYAEEFSLSDNYRVINPTITRKFFKEILEEFKPVYHKNERNNSEGQIKGIVDRIEAIKRNRLSKEDYFKNLEENPEWIPLLKTLNTEKKIQEQQNKIEKFKELWTLYELYQKKMQENDYIDYNDMICMLLDKFESSPLFLEKIANKYEYILVDEYQDTNYVQNQIVFNLVHALKSENVFVVGDDDQIIYSFQGANLDTIQNFLDEFPDTKVICLTENYRSTQNILDVAMNIADQDTRRLCNNKDYCEKYGINKNLTAENKNLDDKKDIKVRLNKYATKEQEVVAICDEIENLIKSDDCPRDKDTKEKKLSEIAILVTRNEGADDFLECLKDKNIQSEVKIGKSIFKIKSSIVLYYYLQMLNQPELYADTFSKLLLIEPFNINSKDYYKLYEGTLNGKSFLETMREDLHWENPDKIHKFIRVYDELVKLKSAETTKNIVLEAGARTGIFDYYFYEETNRLENIAGLKKLTDEARDFADDYDKITLADFVEYLEMIENDRELDITIEPLDIDMNAVQIITYHSSKGREFEYVYMPQLQKSKWEDRWHASKPTIPIKYIEGQDEKYWRQYGTSDKIKTMYVGMTRAIHTLRLSYNIESSRSKPNTWIINAQNLMELNDYTEIKSKDVMYIAKAALTKKNYDYKRDFGNLVTERIKDDHYSPTYMNTYLQCPRRFFYDKILNLSTSKGNPDFTSYGSVMHDTLEYIVTNLLKSDKSEDDKKKLYEEFFKETMNKYAYSSHSSREKFEERGLNELAECYRVLMNFGNICINRVGL